MSNQGLPPTVACCACGADAALVQEQHQGVMMTEDGREVDNPLTCAVFRCPAGHETQAIYDHDEGDLRLQETPDHIIF